MAHRTTGRTIPPRALGAAMAFVLIGCGVSGASPAPTTPRAEPPPESGLVWTVDADGRHRTLWVSLDGGALASQPIEGPVWGSDGALWQWSLEDVEVPLYVEDPEDPTQRRPSGAYATVYRAVLRDVVSDQRVTVVEAPQPGEVRAVEHVVSLAGSVGPYLFVTESLSLDAFGAHGQTQARALVWDLRAAGPTEVLTDRERAAIAREEARRAQARLAEDGAEHGLTRDLEVELVALWPRYREDALELDLQFVTESCYACSDGEWSDYTRSALVESARIPERLAPYAALPDWAQSAAATIPSARVAGISRVERREPAAILDALHR